MAGTVESRERLAALTGGDGPADLADVLDWYDGLPAVEPEAMLGEWDGDVIRTGHPGERLLGELRWAGKAFRSLDDVDPMVCVDEDGARQPSDAMGGASLRRVEYRGVATATMVYDRHPVFDHFRQVSEDTVVGAMDRKGEDAPLVFTLTRRG